MPKLILAGGTGFLGEYLARFFVQRGWSVVSLSRKPPRDADGVRYARWDGETLGDWASELEGADLLVNMAGRTVDCRYTETHKNEILQSRLRSTRVLGEAVARCQQPPRTWMNSSSATIYRDTRGTLPANDETSTQIGDDFSMGVCRQWEAVFAQAPAPQTRKLVLRTAIVLGNEGGALAPLAGLARWWLGGTQGDGDQYFSWLHVADFARIVWFLYEHPELEGVFNLAAPNPVPNYVLMRSLRRSVRRAWGLPLPKFLVRFGAILLRTEAELVLKSRKVVSKRLAEAGFDFEFPTLDAALADLLEKSARS